MLIGTIVWFLLLLSLLVIIHELGHFLMAKWAGVHVPEFGLGYPPKVRDLFQRWGTVFSLNAIPVGGFVRLYGDDSETIAPDLLEAGRSKQEMFAYQSRSKRLIIVLAGVVVNFVFGIAAFALLFSFIGIPTQRELVAITEITTDSPAQAAQFQTGDLILSWQAEGEAAMKIKSSSELIEVIDQHRGETVSILVQREGAEVWLRPTLRTEKTATAGLLGVGLSDSELRFYPWWQMPWRGAWQGWQDSLQLSRMILQSLGEMLARLVLKGEVPKDISGPVGIVNQAYQVGVLQQGILGSVHFAGQLSVNLAIMNLLPIPALDGGRALFILMERVIGPERRRRWEGKANTVGFLFLLTLILLVTVKDIIGLFS